MSSYKNDNKLIGFFGRLNYDFNNKYDLLVSIRREGSSKFGANYQWGNFPAVSAGWSINKESFLALALKKLMSNDSDDPLNLQPLYLRRSSAEEQWDKRLEDKANRER